MYHIQSPKKKKLLRIDYLFISQVELPAVSGTQIGIQSISDHAPIVLSMDLLNPRPKSSTWRLNSFLLTDPTLLPKIATSLTDYFQLNETPDMDPLMIWEAHEGKTDQTGITT